MSREARARAWDELVRESGKAILTRGGLTRLRRAGETLRLTVADMEDIERAIGYRSYLDGVADGEVYALWASVRKFRDYSHLPKA